MHLSFRYLLHCTLLLFPKSFLCWNPQKSFHSHPPCKTVLPYLTPPPPQLTLPYSAPLSVFILASKHLLKRCTLRTKVTSLLERDFFPPTSYFHCDLSVFPQPSPFLYCGKNRLSSLVYILLQASFSSWRFLQLSGDTCPLC